MKRTIANKMTTLKTQATICSLNDKIKEYLDPDGIQFLIDNKMKLLSE